MFLRSNVEMMIVDDTSYDDMVKWCYDDMTTWWHEASQTIEHMVYFYRKFTNNNPFSRNTSFKCYTKTSEASDVGMCQKPVLLIGVRLSHQHQHLHKPLCGRLCSYPEVSADEDVDAGDDEEGEDELEHWGKYRVPKLHNNT